MPTSNPILIHDMVRLIKIINPKSVLDVGCGFGKWGFLCREMLDIAYERYEKKDWKVQIDGVEIFKSYMTPVHSYIYNNISNVDIRKSLIGEKYDLIILADVLEHMTKEEALCVLNSARVMGKHVIVSTPKGLMEQGKVLGNENERHIFGFEMKELYDMGAQVIDCGIVFIAHFNGEKNENTGSKSDKQEA